VVAALLAASHRPSRALTSAPRDYGGYGWGSPSPVAGLAVCVAGRRGLRRRRGPRSDQPASRNAGLNWRPSIRSILAALRTASLQVGSISTVLDRQPSESSPSAAAPARPGARVCDRGGAAGGGIVEPGGGSRAPRIVLNPADGTIRAGEAGAHFATQGAVERARNSARRPACSPAGFAANANHRSRPIASGRRARSPSRVPHACGAGPVSACLPLRCAVRLAELWRTVTGRTPNFVAREGRVPMCEDIPACRRAPPGALDHSRHRRRARSAHGVADLSDAERCHHYSGRPTEHSACFRRVRQREAIRIAQGARRRRRDPAGRDPDRCTGCACDETCLVLDGEPRSRCGPIIVRGAERPADVRAASLHRNRCLVARRPSIAALAAFPAGP